MNLSLTSKQFLKRRKKYFFFVLACIGRRKLISSATGPLVRKRRQFLSGFFFFHSLYTIPHTIYSRKVTTIVWRLLNQFFFSWIESDFLLFVVLSFFFSFFFPPSFIFVFAQVYAKTSSTRWVSRQLGSPHREGRPPTGSDSASICRSTSILKATLRSLHRLPWLKCQAPFAFGRQPCLSAAECGSLCLRL